MFYVLDCAGALGIDQSAVENIAGITHLVVLVIKVIVPVLLVIFGMLDLGKAVVAQKDDEIKKGQKTLISRAIAAAIVFAVVSLVQLIIGLLLRNDDEKDEITECFSCFINKTNC